MMKLLASLALAGVTASADTIARRENINVNVPITKPNGAQVVPKDFVGFGLESAFLLNFANDFSENLVTSLAERMSAPPVIRVGGTSGDHFKYDANQRKPRVCLTKNKCGSSEGKFQLGPSFFDSYGRFNDAKMTIQAPVQNPVNLTMSLAYVWNAWNQLDQGKRVASIALGNEVEFIYHEKQGYVDAALKIQDAIVKNLSLSGDAANIFEIANTASGSTSYKPTDLLAAGINKNKRSKLAAMHWYMINQPKPWTDETMQSIIMNHSAVTRQWDEHFGSNMAAAKKQNMGFTIDEGAAVLSKAPLEWGGGFAYGLWALEENLVAMVRGAARVSNMGARPEAKRQFWSPDDSAGKGSPGPQVRAPYPSAIFMADLIGKGDMTAVTEVDLKRDLISAWAVYDNMSKKLQRLAILNLRLYNPEHGNPRGFLSFGIKVGKDVKRVKVHRLHAAKGIKAMGYDFGGPEHNVTWAGEQWSQKIDMGKGHYVDGKVQENVIAVKDGVASVNVSDTEAVIVFLER